MTIMPSVAMNGGTRSREMTIPLMAPRNVVHADRDDRPAAM